MENVEVYDNGGKSFDRYLVFIGDDVFVMSHNPHSPQGVNMYAGDRSEGYFGPTKDMVSFDALPVNIRVAIRRRASGDYRI